MNWTCSEIESDVVSILEMKSLPLSVSYDDGKLKQFIKIRELCVQADKADILPNGGQLGWRRGTGGGGNGGHNHTNNHNHGGNRPQGLPNRWRGQGPMRPQPKPSGPPSERSNGSSSGGGSGGGRYMSKFQNSDSPLEDKILNQVILNKLNKFSSANYEEVKAFLQQIMDSDEKDFLRDFMLLVFKKAASEPTFCPLYARMIAELSVSYKSLVDELTNLYTKYLAIFEEVSEDQCKDYEQFVQRNREKIHRLGYSQFLAELTSRGVLTQTQIQQLFDTILQQIKSCSSEDTSKQQLVEEYSDCLLRMSKAFQGTKSASLLAIRSGLGANCDSCITDILANRTANYPGLSKKAQFTLMDCLDIFRNSK
jgi:hypothetical protein